MKPQKSLKLALNFLYHSKLRSWLTIIGIVIGVSAVVVIVSIGEGMSQRVSDRIGDMGADLITISAGGGGATAGFHMPGGERRNTGTSSEQANLTIKDTTALKSIAGIKTIQGTISGNSEVYFLGELATLGVSGVDPASWEDVTTATLASGRPFDVSEFSSVIIGHTIATTTFDHEILLNQMITVEGKSFKVVGILEEGTDDRTIIMPIDAARTVIEDKDNDNFDSIIVQVEDVDDVDAVVEKIESKLMLTRHVSERDKDFSVTSAKSIQESMNEITGTMTLFLSAIAAVSLLVGAVGIANTMFTAVLEKTKEIGIMKAIGAKNQDIMYIFLFNAALVGVVGGLLGIALGVLVSIIVVPLLGIKLGPGGVVSSVISVELLAFVLLFSIAIGLIAGVVPAYQASKLKPVDALRYE